MQMWLFFTIFGSVLFFPSLILFLILNRLKKTIVVLIKHNGTLKKIVITDKILDNGRITEYKGKKIKPITVKREEIYYGNWRRWIIKGELESTDKSKISDKDIEEYLNNEDLLKLYLAGKFKDTLMMLLGVIIVGLIIGFVINGYLINTQQCVLTPTNQTTAYLQYIVKSSIMNLSQG